MRWDKNDWLQRHSFEFTNQLKKNLVPDTRNLLPEKYPKFRLPENPTTRISLPDPIPETVTTRLPDYPKICYPCTLYFYAKRSFLLLSRVQREYSNWFTTEIQNTKFFKPNFHAKIMKYNTVKLCSYKKLFLNKNLNLHQCAKGLRECTFGLMGVEHTDM